MQPMPANASTARSRLLSCEVAAVCLARVGVRDRDRARVGGGLGLGLGLTDQVDRRLRRPA